MDTSNIQDGTIIIGWDVGSWNNGKHGICICKWTKREPEDSGTLSLVHSKSYTFHQFRQALTDGVILNYNFCSSAPNPVLFVADAPFRLPIEYSSLAANQSVYFFKQQAQNHGMLADNTAEIYKLLAYRITDNWVYKIVSDRPPLSGSLDKLASNFTVALCAQKILQEVHKYSIQPFSQSVAPGEKVMIEAYPKATRYVLGIFDPAREKGKKESEKLKIRKELFSSIIQNSAPFSALVNDIFWKEVNTLDRFDALICCITGLYYLAGKCYTPNEIDDYSSKINQITNEGWIYFPMTKEDLDRKNESQ